MCPFKWNVVRSPRKVPNILHLALFGLLVSLFKYIYLWVCNGLSMSRVYTDPNNQRSSKVEDRLHYYTLNEAQATLMCSKLRTRHSDRKSLINTEWLHLPATRLYTCGSLLLLTQWAAVMAHLGLIRDAPQGCPFITLSDSCQGHELGVAVEPPTIRAPGRCPHWATA